MLGTLDEKRTIFQITNPLFINDIHLFGPILITKPYFVWFGEKYLENE
jgi:hypothetical protein